MPGRGGYPMTAPHPGHINYFGKDETEIATLLSNDQSKISLGNFIYNQVNNVIPNDGHPKRLDPVSRITGTLLDQRSDVLAKVLSDEITFATKAQDVGVQIQNA